MARGKYKQRKHNQDAAQLATDLAQVRAQLDEELARLAAMRERAELDARLRAELRAAIAARDAVCAPQLQRIAVDRDAIRVASRQLDEAVRELARHWSRSTSLR